MMARHAFLRITVVVWLFCHYLTGRSNTFISRAGPAGLRVETQKQELFYPVSAKHGSSRKTRKMHI
jgi:hypothetical protein